MKNPMRWSSKSRESGKCWPRRALIVISSGLIHVIGQCIRWARVVRNVTGLMLSLYPILYIGTIHPLLNYFYVLDLDYWSYNIIIYFAFFYWNLLPSYISCYSFGFEEGLWWKYMRDKAGLTDTEITEEDFLTIYTRWSS